MRIRFHFHFGNGHVRVLHFCDLRQAAARHAGLQKRAVSGRSDGKGRPQCSQIGVASGSGHQSGRGLPSPKPYAPFSLGHPVSRLFGSLSRVFALALERSAIPARSAGLGETTIPVAAAVAIGAGARAKTSAHFKAPLVLRFVTRAMTRSAFSA